MRSAGNRSRSSKTYPAVDTPHPLVERMAPPLRLRCWHSDRSTADGETVKHPRSAGGTASKVLWHICGTKGEKRCPAGSGPATTGQDRSPSQRVWSLFQSVGLRFEPDGAHFADSIAMNESGSRSRLA